MLGQMESPARRAQARTWTRTLAGPQTPGGCPHATRRPSPPGPSGISSECLLAEAGGRGPDGVLTAGLHMAK